MFRAIIIFIGIVASTSLAMADPAKSPPCSVEIASDIPAKARSDLHERGITYKKLVSDLEKIRQDLQQDNDQLADDLDWVLIYEFFDATSPVVVNRLAISTVTSVEPEALEKSFSLHRSVLKCASSVENAPKNSSTRPQDCATEAIQQGVQLLSDQNRYKRYISKGLNTYNYYSKFSSIDSAVGEYRVAQRRALATISDISEKIRDAKIKRDAYFRAWDLVVSGQGGSKATAAAKCTIDVCAERASLAKLLPQSRYTYMNSFKVGACQSSNRTEETTSKIDLSELKRRTQNLEAKNVQDILESYNSQKSALDNSSFETALSAADQQISEIKSGADLSIAGSLSSMLQYQNELNQLNAIAATRAPDEFYVSKGQSAIQGQCLQNLPLNCLCLSGQALIDGVTTPCERWNHPSCTSNGQQVQLTRCDTD